MVNAFEEAVQPLGVLPSDITWLAQAWEGRLAALDYPTRKFAVVTLLELCAAYLRGKGVRLGSYQGIRKWGTAHAALVLLVVKRVVDDEGKGSWFPTLLRLGFVTIEGATGAMASLEQGAEHE